MTTRKGFLATVPLYGLAPVLLDASPAPSAAPSAQRTPLTFSFDQAGFDAVLAKTAKHKQCFGAKDLNDGGVLNAMQNSINAYEDYLHEAPGSMRAVAVLYHGTSVALAMNDSLWDSTLAALVQHGPAEIRDQMKGTTLGKGNPYLHSLTKDPDDVSVERLVAQGSTFFVCHNAILGFASEAARVLKISRKAAHDRIMSNIVPGAIVVPAGVMAINACQEAHFTYIAA